MRPQLRFVIVAMPLATLGATNTPAANRSLSRQARRRRCDVKGFDRAKGLDRAENLGKIVR